MSDRNARTGLRCLAPVIAAVATGACATSTPLETVEYVDLERFGGDWYVIANIPTFLEKDAYNAVESYSHNGDGTIDTVFTFRKGGFDGEKKRYNPKGFVRNRETNAVWGMQFIWPIKADYRVIYLDDAYRITVIGRNKRDYVWIMAREPQIDPAELDAIIEFAGEVGYDVSKIQLVPQQW